MKTLTLTDRVEEIRERIERACQRAGREPEEITLVAVSKTFPLEAIHEAMEAGLRDFGENRVQELDDKAAALPGEYLGGEVRWHMIGHLQRNKARDTVRTTDLFHGLDSPRLAREIDKRARKEGRVMPCLVQVNVADDENKYGFDPEATHPFLDELQQYESIRVEGLMTIVPHVDDPETVRPAFAQLRELAATYSGGENVDLRTLSMGMTNDFEIAIEEGATMVRIGRALFGARNYD